MRLCLTLRLTRAPKDLAYDSRQDMFRPVRVGEEPEVTRVQLYYQATRPRRAGARPVACSTRGTSL